MNMHMGDEIVDVDRWVQNGDHPLDFYERGTFNEGKLIRRYRTPECDGLNECPECGYYMHDHGWIDSGGDGKTVCPGDWIIKPKGGKHFPMKDAEFKLSCRPIQEAAG